MDETTKQSLLNVTIANGNVLIPTASEQKADCVLPAVNPQWLRLNSRLRAKYVERSTTFVNALAEEVHANAINKGWWEKPRDIGELLMLVVTEVAEAMEDFRNDVMVSVERDGKPCGFPTELADIVIRVFDIAGALEIDLGEEILRKMEYNKTRSYRHGGKRA